MQNWSTGICIFAIDLSLCEGCL